MARRPAALRVLLMLAAGAAAATPLSAQDDPEWLWNGTITIVQRYRYGPKIAAINSCQTIQDHRDGEVTIRLADDPVTGGVVSAVGRYRGTQDVTNLSAGECKDSSPPCRGVGNHQTASGAGPLTMALDLPKPYDDGSYFLSYRVEEPIAGRKHQVDVGAGGCTLQDVPAEVYPVPGIGPLLQGEVEPKRPDHFAGSRTVVSDERTITVTWDLTRSRPSPYEVVVIPQAVYRGWLPEAGEAEETPGNALAMHAELRMKGKPDKKPDQKARFRWELLEVSREPGINLNTPARDRAGAGFDLRIAADHDPELTVSEQAQSAETKQAQRSSDVLIHAHDYGAFGKLRVVATLEDGTTVTGFLEGNRGLREIPLPRDENGNRVADAWEEEMGILARNLPADWDGADQPAGQRAPGDGITLYEKYRGLRIEGVHERLDPKWKHLFVYDPNNLIRDLERKGAEMGIQLPTFEEVFGMRLRLVAEDEWSGPGSSAEERRIVNFNHGWGHGAAQHALHLMAYENREFRPQDYREFLDRHGLYDGPEGSLFGLGASRLGMAYPDMDHAIGSPRHTFQVAIFFGGIDDFIYEDVWSSFCWGDAANRAKMKAIDEANRAEGRASRDGCYKIADELFPQVREYLDQHPEQLRERFYRSLAYTMFHELAHGVGVQHHAKVSDGDRASIMRYVDASKDCEPNAGDPFLLRCYDPWPNRLCRTVEDRRLGTSCWKQVIVSDRADAAMSRTPE